MKKTIIITAAAFMLALPTVKATTISNEINLTESNYEKTPTYNVSAFCVAIVKGDLDTVKKLISLGEDVNGKSQGMTPLMYAAKYNRVNVLRYLIEKGANLNTRSSKGKTALYYAKSTNAKDTYTILKEMGKKKK